MFKKNLSNRVIIFCGGIGSGKSICANILSDLLKKSGQKVICINSYKDLYLPFAKKHKYDLPPGNMRKDMTLLIQRLYRRHGKNLGSKLLLDIIQKKNDAIYILDSKRNPEGISYIKQILGERCLIIGVISDTSTRGKRIIKRAREIDSGILVKDINELIKNEELMYDVLKAIGLSDFIICNSDISIIKIRQMLKPMSVRLSTLKTEENEFAKAFWEKLLLTYKKTLPKKFLDFDDKIFVRIISIIINNQFNFKLASSLLIKKVIFNVDKNKIQFRKNSALVNFIFKKNIEGDILLLGLVRFYKLYSARLFSDDLAISFPAVLNEQCFESINECEVKFSLTSDVRNKIEAYISKTSVIYRGVSILEDDLVIDTEAHDLKKLGVLLRFRISEKNQHSLLTIKFKKARGLIKQDVELQKMVSNDNKIFLNLVNNFLQALNLPMINFENLIHIRDGNKLENYFKHTRYRRVRMRIQKKRQVFKIKENETICFDELPEGIGRFVEIESDSLKNVERIMCSIGLRSQSIIKEDYGEMVISYNKSHGVKNDRVAKFSNNSQN